MSVLEVLPPAAPDLSVDAVLSRRQPPEPHRVQLPHVRGHLPVSRVGAAKQAWTVRRLPLTTVTDLVTDRSPCPGDAVLARVLEVGQHARLESPHGRRQRLCPGDEVVVVYGDRYAPDQFEALVPSDVGLCELVAGGGVAARVAAMHEGMEPATLLEPVGLLAGRSGAVLNVRDHVRTAMDPTASTPRPVTVAVAGSAMNAGKTTTAASLVRGAVLAGHRVGAAKVTGTGSGGDRWALVDAGAAPVLDFSDRGLVTTYRVGHDEVRRVFVELVEELSAAGCDLVVLELADGLYQQETAGLLADPEFGSRVDGLLFAAQDALGAAAAQAWLRDRGLAPLALSGVLSASPLAMREARRATGLDVWSAEHLSDAGLVDRLVHWLRAVRDDPADRLGGGERRIGGTAEVVGRPA